MNLSLGIGLGLTHQRGGGAPTNPLCDAIKHQVCVRAEHKGKSLKLAPHIVYVRKGERTLDALVLETDGKPANKKKLASYSVAELASISATGESFEPSAGFDPNEPEYLSQPECVVETV